MKVLSYIRKYYPLQQCSLLLLLCVLTGMLPARLIPLESTLIDQALAGIPPAGHLRFFVSLGGYLLLLAAASLLQTLLQRTTQQHTLETEQTMERQRWEKARNAAFPLTETPRFHELLGQAGKAAALDADCCTALENAVVGTVKIIASLTVLMRIDRRVVGLLAAVLLLGTAIHARASKQADGFWGEYLQNMRRANYHSSLLLHREYASERKIFAYGQEIGARYERDYAQAVRKTVFWANKDCMPRRLSRYFPLRTVSLFFWYCCLRSWADKSPSVHSRPPGQPPISSAMSVIRFTMPCLRCPAASGSYLDFLPFYSWRRRPLPRRTRR